LSCRSPAACTGRLTDRQQLPDRRPGRRHDHRRRAAGILEAAPGRTGRGGQGPRRRAGAHPHARGPSDHIGFAARLHRETGVAAYIHEADVDRARLKVKKPNSGWGPVKIGPMAGFLWYSAWRGGLRPRPATELQTVAIQHESARASGAESGGGRTCPPAAAAAARRH
jgi:hypothetical protein